MPGSGRALRAPGEPLRIVFVGQAVERKGLPVLLRAFEALRRQVPAELTVVGVEPAGARADAARPRGRHGARARSATPRSAPRWRPPTCCAPRRWAASRSGWCSRRRSRPARRSSPRTSRATATSSRDRGDGLLVPRGDATRLAETLRDLALDPARTRAAGHRAPPAAPSATRGRGWPPRSPPPTRTRAPSSSPRARSPAPPSGSARARPTASRSRARRLPSLEPPVEGATRPAFKLAPPRAAGRRGARGRRRRAAGARADRHAPDRPGAAGLEPDLGARRARADVRSRCACAPSPGTRSSRRRCPTRCRASPTPCRAPRSGC